MATQGLATAAEFTAWMIPQLKGIRAAVLEHYSPDSCIISTAVLIKHLRKQLGPRVLSVPLSVDVMLANMPYMEQYKRIGKKLPNAKLLQRWIEKYGAWSIGLGAFKDGDTIAIKLGEGKLLFEEATVKKELVTSGSDSNN